jgi:ferredoxin
MTLDIFVHSGTGNSLLAAKKLARSLKGARLRPMAELPWAAREGRGSGALGLVFPVNFYALPRFLVELLEKSDLRGREYIFAAATNGGDAGNALWQADRLLRRKGARLDYGVELPMGDNSITIATPPAVLEERMSDLGGRIDDLARAVASGERLVGPYRFKARAAAVGKIMDAGYRLLYRAGKGAADRAACSGCGICARLCPVGNIRMEDGRPAWGDRCALCFACVNWCPRKVVSLGRISPAAKGAQFRCPGVEAEELMAAGARPGMENMPRAK